MLNDWRRFKQLETEQREEQCREMERLVRKLSMTCRSHLDEEERQHKQKDLQEKISGKVISSPRAFAALPLAPRGAVSSILSPLCHGLAEVSISFAALFGLAH